jgi:NAD(P)-dependent dehydrogenase (short-subunit alcohol dehydrogenase family)
VHRLSQAGASVVLTGRGIDALKKVESQVSAAGGRALGVQADLASLQDSQHVIDQAIQTFGRVDILVNNAAVFPGAIFLEVTEKIWDDTVDPDLKGAFFLAQFAAKAMIAASRGGRIINLLSTDAFRPTGMLSAYGAAKLGLWSATQALAKELAEHQILVNAVTPGATITQDRLDKLADGSFAGVGIAEGAAQTRAKVDALVKSGAFLQMLKMMPLGRPGWPDEIAKAVLFLASDMGSYVSGANIIVDGAQTLR